jgi:hypothetical protein
LAKESVPATGPAEGSIGSSVPYNQGNLFLFGGVEVPATKPEPLDCQVFGELPKLF